MRTTSEKNTRKGNKLDKRKFLLYSVATYCVLLIANNTIAGKTFDVLGFSWSSAFVTFPIVYILNDVFSEVYGFRTARRIILLSFALNLLSVLVYQLALIVPGSPYFTGQEAFEVVFSTTPRALVASFAGYLVGSTLNAAIMQRMHDAHGERHLMARCVTSTLFGELSDAAVFNFGMLLGVLPVTTILGTVVSFGLAKVAYEAAMYPITKQVINRVKSLG